MTNARLQRPVVAGFSLIEATVAMTISTVLVLAVGSVFIVQSTFYNRLNGDALIQDQARLMVAEIQRAAASMVDEGVVLAEADRFVIRKPQSLAMVCALQGGNAHSHLAAGIDAVDDDTADGMGKLDPATGVWTFVAGSTTSVTGPTGGTPANRCFTNGTDTVGARDDFMRLNGLNGWFGATPVVGDIYMFYEEVEYSIDTSVLKPEVKALFKGEYGEDLSELVTNLDTAAAFEYRVSGSWRSSVSAGLLDDIDAVRVTASTIAPSSGTAGGDALFELVVDVPLRN